MRRREPVAPVIRRSPNRAFPAASVTTVVVPLSCPPPPVSATVISTPATGTSWPAPSLTWTIVPGVRIAPTSTEAGGCVVTARFEGAPVPLAVAENVTLPTPETTAFTVLVPGEEPRVQRVYAIPSLFVWLVSGFMLPPPTPMTQATALFGIGLL